MFPRRVRDGETGTLNGCNNGTYFFTATSPMQIDDNDDPGKTPDSATFGIETGHRAGTGPAG